MSITVNGKSVPWVKGETVTALLTRMKYTFPLVVVKINNNVISKKEFATTAIPNGADVAVIHMISGG
ncbi:MAG: sulfur carrier protein ThiS [Candidatus Thermoplasmatota archaeon]|nr:sulfur carrier protein ThiS [Candidatus Thermoplasmatota archaeon]